MSEEEQYHWKEEAEKLLEFDFSHHLNQIKLASEDGWLDMGKVYLFLYNLEKLSGAIKGEIIEKAVKDIGEYEKGCEINGFKLEKINSAGRWDYSKIEDWKKRKDSLKEYEKELQQSFRAWEKGNEMFNNGTGEKVPVPAYIPGKETIKVTNVKGKN